MRRLIGALFLSGIMVFVFSGCGSKESGTSVTVTEVGTVEGIVTSASTGAALSDVTVQIGDKSAVTSGSGVYTLNDIETGSRTITAALSGYENYSGTVTITKGTTVAFDIPLTPTASSGDAIAPSVPADLTATALSSSQINLSWTASTDNVGVAGYAVYRTGTLLKSIAETATSDTGLSAATEYCYTVQAYDSAGNKSAETAQVCAATPAASDTIAPSVPSGLAAATAASAAQINLTWNASTDTGANASGVAGYEVYRDGTKLATTSGTSYLDSGLSASTQYCYTLLAYDAAGNKSAQSSSQCATTSGGGGPSGLVAYYPFTGNADDASGNGNDGTVHNATLTSDNSGQANSAYHFPGLNGYISVTGNSALNTITTTKAMTVAAWIYVEGWDTDGYYFPIAAIEDGWELVIIRKSSTSTTGYITLGMSGTGTGDTGTTVSMNAWHHVAASFDDASDSVCYYLDGASAGCTAYTKAMTAYAQPLNIAFNPYGTDNYSVGSIDEVRIYNTVLTAAEVSAIYTNSIAPSDTTAPSVPSGLAAATAASAAQINLTWNASTDTGADASGVAGYEVYRDGAKLATTSSTSYLDTGLSASTQYCYTIIAYDAASNTSAQSTSQCATTSAASDATAPSVPAGLTATMASTSRIDVSWTASSDSGTNASGIAGYELYRDGTKITTTTGSSYSDISLTASTQYCYTVLAYDAAGNKSAQSASQCATTGCASTSVTVDASSTAGVSTGISVASGDVVSFTAPGTWCWGGGADCSTADGTAGRPNAGEHPVTLEGQNFGALIGQVGTWLFPIGSSSSVTMEASGTLALLMNDRVGYYGDNSGSLTVTVTGACGASTNGLVAYYPFTGNANDASGNGNNGAAKGATLTTDRSGNTNSAYAFDGVSSYIEIPDADMLDQTGNFTVSVWLKPNAGGGMILNKHYNNSNNDGSWWMALWGTSEIEFQATPNWSMLPSSPTITLGQWSHIVFVYDDANKTYDIYLNDAKTDTGLVTLDITNTTRKLYIGAEESASMMSFFNGSIDDIRIYNRALSAHEIELL